MSQSSIFFFFFYSRCFTHVEGSEPSHLEAAGDSFPGPFHWDWGWGVFKDMGTILRPLIWGARGAGERIVKDRHVHAELGQRFLRAVELRCSSVVPPSLLHTVGCYVHTAGLLQFKTRSQMSRSDW